MAKPWRSLGTQKTPDGVLELRQRDAHDFLITHDGRVLMNSVASRSEVALGQLACRGLLTAEAPRVLIGGLGMGLTLRAVLDVLPADARVIVAELNPIIVEWCKGPLAELNQRAVFDPRVSIEIADVAAVIRRAAEGKSTKRYEAIAIDLYVGPDAGTRVADPLYGKKALVATRGALRRGGTFAVWGEAFDDGFAKRLQDAGFATKSERPGKGGLRHVVYVATAE